MAAVVTRKIPEILVDKEVGSKKSYLPEYAS